MDTNKTEAEVDALGTLLGASITVDDDNGTEVFVFEAATNEDQAAPLPMQFMELNPQVQQPMQQQHQVQQQMQQMQV